MLKTRRFLVLLLVAVLVFTQLPAKVLAADEGVDNEDITSGTTQEGITSDTPQSNNTTMSTPTGTVTALDALPNEIRWQNTGALIIPETVSSTVDGEVQQIPVAWEADHELKTQGCSRLIAEDTTLSRNILIF